MGGLERAVSTLSEELKAVVHQGLVEKHAPFAQEISTVTDDFNTSVSIISIESEKDLVMRQDRPLLDGNALGGPCSLNCIVILTLMGKENVKQERICREVTPRSCSQAQSCEQGCRWT